MFSKLTHQQNLADFLKEILDNYARTPDQRRVTKAVYPILKRFEAVDWYPQAFEQALAETASGWITMNDSGDFTYTPRKDAVDIVERLLSRYLELVGQENEREII